MKKLIQILAIFSSLAFFSQSKSITSADIRWKGYKILKAESLSHNGTLKLKSGNLLLKNDQIIGGNFVMDMNTMDAEDLNKNPKLKKMFENHLRSDDFFDSAHFPVSTFQIKSVKKLTGKSYNSQIFGVLTIKEISKNINFPANITEANGVLTLTSGKFTFNRKNFNLNYNIFEDMLISNEVEISVNLTAN